MNQRISRDDKIFQKDIESCRFPVSDFDHRAHIRLAYIYLVATKDVATSVELVRNSLIGLLNHVGIEPSAKYHETLTEAWLLAVNHFMHSHRNANSADEFIDNNPKLLNSKIMLTHYSEALLFSEEARAKFIAPDLEPIPKHVTNSA